MKNRSKWEGIGLTDKELYENEFDGYYIYLHIHIPTNTIWYVGKGCRRRAVSFNRRPYYQEYLNGEIEVDVIARLQDEQDALKQEEFEIFYYKLVNMAKYNNQNFHTGKCRGEVKVRKEEVEELSIQEKYDFTNIHNISIPPFELQMIRNKELRSNTVEFMNSLESYTQEQLEDVIGGYEQWVYTEEDSDLQMAYRFVLRYMRRYYEKN